MPLIDDLTIQYVKYSNLELEGILKRKKGYLGVCEVLRQAMIGGIDRSQKWELFGRIPTTISAKRRTMYNKIEVTPQAKSSFVAGNMTLDEAYIYAKKLSRSKEYCKWEVRSRTHRIYREFMVDFPSLTASEILAIQQNVRDRFHDTYEAD